MYIKYLEAIKERRRNVKLISHNKQQANWLNYSNVG